MDGAAANLPVPGASGVRIEGGGGAGGDGRGEPRQGHPFHSLVAPQIADQVPRHRRARRSAVRATPAAVAVRAQTSPRTQRDEAMTFLPIVERELRVAARRAATHWMRFFAALAAMLIWLLLAWSTPQS